MYLATSLYNYLTDNSQSSDNKNDEEKVTQIEQIETKEFKRTRKVSFTDTDTTIEPGMTSTPPRKSSLHALPSTSSSCSCCHPHSTALATPVRSTTPPIIRSTMLTHSPPSTPKSSTPIAARRQGVAFVTDTAAELTPALSSSNIPASGGLGGSQALLDRRTSAWGSAALMDRRPSAMLQLGTCGACGDHRRFLISILRQQHGSARQLSVEGPPVPPPSIPSPVINNPGPKIKILEPSAADPPVPPYKEEDEDVEKATPKRERKSKRSRRQDDDALTAGLSALYAKLLFVLGIAFPVAEVISDKVPPSFDQGFYVYLYVVSLAFMIYMYATLMKDRSAYSVVRNYDVEGERQQVYVRNRHRDVPVIRYGSFYLRAGAIAFGIGSMIYSGLEFGQYFELQPDSDCHNVLLALTPAMRMVLTIMQIQFLFLNNRFEMGKYRLVARFGLMHMLATNMCEWLYVLVEEAKHEILHLSHLTHPSSNHTDDDDDHHDRVDRAAHAHDCMRTNIMGSLVQNASPFLFPCTIEYSLICAVILFEMWKNVNTMIENKKRQSIRNKSYNENNKQNSMNGYKLAAGKLIDPSNNHHFSVDCASAHRGLFSGIIILVLTIISLIMFFVLIRDPLFSHMAVFEVNICEIIMYIASTIAVIVCMKQMRELEYKKGNHGFELDGILIVVAQTGMYVYCLFSIIGSYFSEADNAPGGLLTELCSLIQTTCQTIFILDAWWRRSENLKQIRKKPGRQLVTFLLIANLAMWTINSLEKNRAEFHPTHLEFYGVWAWTIITHVSMPLAVFYRFHSTVCLLEIWKTAYKLKHESHH